MKKLFNTLAFVSLIFHIGSWNMEARCTEGTAHLSEPIIIHDGARLVEYEGRIMSVDYADRHIFLKETRFLVGQFLMGDKLFSTQMENSHGRNANIGQFRGGQMVSISGYAVSKSDVCAVSIKPLSGYLRQDRRRVDKLERLRF